MSVFTGSNINGVKFPVRRKRIKYRLAAPASLSFCLSSFSSDRHRITRIGDIPLVIGHKKKTLGPE